MNCLFVENRGIGVSVIVLYHVAGPDATVSLTHASGVNWVEFGFGGVEWRDGSNLADVTGHGGRILMTPS